MIAVMVSHLKPYCIWKRFSDDLSVNPRSKELREIADRHRETRIKKLQTVLQCCLLRRTKTSRIDGSTEPILVLPPRHMAHVTPAFSDEEEKLYRALEQRNFKRFMRMADNLERHYRSILVMIMRMRQMCLHPSLIANGRDILRELLDADEESQSDGEGGGVDAKPSAAKDRRIVARRLAEFYDAQILQRLEIMIADDGIDDCPICLEA